MPLFSIILDQELSLSVDQIMPTTGFINFYWDTALPFTDIQQWLFYTTIAEVKNVKTY